MSDHSRSNFPTVHARPGLLFITQELFLLFAMLVLIYYLSLQSHLRAICLVSMLVLVYYLSLERHGRVNTYWHARPGLSVITQELISATSTMTGKVRIFDRGHAKRECSLESPGAESSS